MSIRESGGRRAARESAAGHAHDISPSAISTASGGTAGRMYGISFALAHEKATSVTPAATRQKAARGIARSFAPGEERHEQRPRQQSEREHRNVKVERFGCGCSRFRTRVADARRQNRSRRSPARVSSSRQTTVPRSRVVSSQAGHRAEFCDRAAQFALQRQPNQHRRESAAPHRRAPWSSRPGPSRRTRSSTSGRLPASAGRAKTSRSSPAR